MSVFTRQSWSEFAVLQAKIMSKQTKTRWQEILHGMRVVQLNSSLCVISGILSVRWIVIFNIHTNMRCHPSHLNPPPATYNWATITRLSYKHTIVWKLCLKYLINLYLFLFSSILNPVIRFDKFNSILSPLFWNKHCCVNNRIMFVELERMVRWTYITYSNSF